MKRHILKLGICILGALSLLLAWVVRKDYRWQKTYILEQDVIYDTDRYGDLFLMNGIWDFGEKLPPRQTDYFQYTKHPNESDILLFGDSFLYKLRFRSIPEWLEDTSKFSVSFCKDYYPLTTLQDSGYTDTSEKVIIYQMVERYIPLYFHKRHPLPVELQWHALNSNLQTTNESERSLSYQMNNFFSADWEHSYEFILTRGKIFHSMTSILATLKFHIYGKISYLTPYYSLGDISMVYFYESTNQSMGSFFYPHSEETVSHIVDNIEHLQNELRSRYNLRLVFFPVPNKISIYHEGVIDQPYNDFLPLLYKELESREIPVIDVLNEMKNADDLLYYPTDTHWNERGNEIGMFRTLQMLDTLGVNWRK